MSTQTKEELLAKIEPMELEPDTRDAIIAKINAAETVDAELIGWIKEQIQEEIDGIFAAAGVEDDENDPEYKVQYEKMMTEIDNAEKEFQKDMEGINEEMNQIQDDAAKQLDQADADAVAGQIKEM